MHQNLQESSPVLAAEWHPERNKPLTPNNVAKFSNKKVWWKCSKGHEWEAQISNRSRGSGCPFCLGRIADPENNLRIKKPLVAKEWHPTKNGSLTPEQVTCKSNRFAWWVCSEQHEWMATINSRSAGAGCPFCKGKKVTSKTSLYTLNPGLASEWHPTKNGILTPNEVTARSNKTVWWLCPKEHEWEASVDSRSRGQGCPYCIGRKVCPDNCLESINPDLVKEWHPHKNGNLKPSNITANSNRKVWWICKHGHEWNATIYHRNSGSGCPFCSSNKVCIDNCLATLNPDLAKEWHLHKNGIVTPKDVTSKSAAKVWWRCKRNHEWYATVKNRSNGSGCPFCNSATSELEIRIFCEMKYIFEKVEHRAKVHGLECDIYLPNLKFGIEIDGVYWHRNKYTQDKLKGAIFRKNGLKLIRIREAGLKPTCNDDISCVKRESVISVVKKILDKISGFQEINQKLLKRICEYRHASRLMNENESNALIALLPSPFPGSSLEDIDQNVSQEWHPLKNQPITPKDVYPNSNREVWWLCSKRKHEWQARISDRFSKGAGCPYCASKQICSDNSLQAKNPNLAREWHPTKNGKHTPDTVAANSNKKFWWVCPRGHEWEASVDKRNIGRGCPICAYRNRGDSTRLTIRKMQEIANQRGGYCLSKEYINNHSNLHWQCKIGHTWDASPKSIMKGTWCPACSKLHNKRDY
jgi:hypothetical protein